MQKNENIEICENHLVAIKGDPLKSQQSSQHKLQKMYGSEYFS